MKKDYTFNDVYYDGYSKNHKTTIEHLRYQVEVGYPCNCDMNTSTHKVIKAYLRVLKDLMLKQDYDSFKDTYKKTKEVFP